MTSPITPEVIAAFGKAFALLCLEQELQDTAENSGKSGYPLQDDGTFDMVYAEESPTYEALVGEVLEQYGLKETAMPDGSEPPLLKLLRDSGYAAMRDIRRAEVARLLSERANSDKPVDPEFLSITTKKEVRTDKGSIIAAGEPGIPLYALGDNLRVEFEMPQDGNQNVTFEVATIPIDDVVWAGDAD